MGQRVIDPFTIPIKGRYVNTRLNGCRRGGDVRASGSQTSMGGIYTSTGDCGSTVLVDRTAFRRVWGTNNGIILLGTALR